ncbi:MAG: efflux RND transporter periplasmic adaptor subunit [Candidatus Eisenbacteria bacterium]|nr:efflux RND transporter periplasmic adaptor subunit [Candidatus Eisenbacteria bacterium]
MKRYPTILRQASLLFTVALAAAGLSMGCGGGAQEEEAEAGAVPVEVTELSSGMVSPVLGYTGGVQGARRTSLGAEIQGRVETFHVDAGDRVEQGDLLVELGSEQLAQVEAQYRAAERDWKRMQSLHEKNAITDQAFDQAEAGYESARASYDMMLGSTRIRAPFSGYITARHLEEGELFMLMPGGTGAPSILDLADISSVSIEVEVSERDWPLIRKGLPAAIAVDAYPDRTFDGSVHRVDASLDEMSRTATAEVRVPNPEGLLRPGMFADVELTLAGREAVLVPLDGLLRQEGTGVSYVFVIEGGKARRRNIALGDVFGDRVEARSGVAEGDLVVLAGRYRLADGDDVTIERTAGEDR